MWQVCFNCSLRNKQKSKIVHKIKKYSISLYKNNAYNDIKMGFYKIAGSMEKMKDGKHTKHRNRGNMKLKEAGLKLYCKKNLGGESIWN